jgi:hypothetical protein
MHHGVALSRGDDYFGSAVNLAARISARASASAGSAHDVSFARQVSDIGLHDGVGHCVTLCCMSARQFSARLDPDVVDRLERRGARAGLNKSRLAERYIDEGMRMEDHPGIVFRDGPTGRRAGLAAGPDVWEVMSALRSTGLEGDEAIQATVKWSGLTVRQVRDAVGYYSEYPAEIDERIRRNEEEADAAERRWREQSLTR